MWIVGVYLSLKYMFKIIIYHNISLWVLPLGGTSGGSVEKNVLQYLITWEFYKFSECIGSSSLLSA